MQIRQVSVTRLTPLPNRLVISLVCAAVVYAGALAIQTAHAQSTGGNQVSSLEAQAPYDEQTLQSFASAATTVLALRNSYYPRIRAAEIAGSNEKADLLFKEMRKHMHTAIGNSGFSEDQYRAISDAAKTDTVLRQHISSIIQGPSPAQRHFRKVSRVAPKTPQIATAPSNALVSATNGAPAAPVITPVVPQVTMAPADDGARQRLQAELAKTNAERDRYRAEQDALEEKVAALESQLSTVTSQDSALRQQLNAKKKQALEAQKKSKAELDTLQGELANLKQELSTVQSQDSSLREMIEVERARADTEKNIKEAGLAAFRGEIKQLADRLTTAQQALDSLVGDLNPGVDSNIVRTPAFEALTPLRREPSSIERVMARVQPGYAKRQELDGEIARIQKERAHREAERATLQQEIAELSSDLAATYQAMADLIGEPANITVATAQLDIENDFYALDVPQETALLFEDIATLINQAPVEPKATNQAETTDAVGAGDSGIEPSAPEQAESATLEPSPLAPLSVNSAPAAEITTAPTPDVATSAIPTSETENSAAVVQFTHQIVRDEAEFKPAIPPKPAPETQAADPDAKYANTVSGGAKAYQAADYRRAFEIWAPLAESGSRNAQFHLGALYLEGRGTELDFRQAYFWLRLASRRGDERAQPLATMVAEKLTTEEISASEEQTQQWLDKRAIKVTQSESAGQNRL